MVEMFNKLMPISIGLDFIRIIHLMQINGVIVHFSLINSLKALLIYWKNFFPFVIVHYSMKSIFTFLTWIQQLIFVRNIFIGFVRQTSSNRKQNPLKNICSRSEWETFIGIYVRWCWTVVYSWWSGWTISSSFNKRYELGEYQRLFFFVRIFFHWEIFNRLFKRISILHRLFILFDRSTTMIEWELIFF